MNLWKISLLFVCLIAVSCKSETLDKLEEDEPASGEKMVEDERASEEKMGEDEPAREEKMVEDVSNDASEENSVGKKSDNINDKEEDFKEDEKKEDIEADDGDNIEIEDQAEESKDEEKEEEDSTEEKDVPKNNKEIQDNENSKEMKDSEDSEDFGKQQEQQTAEEQEYEDEKKEKFDEGEKNEQKDEASDKLDEGEKEEEADQDEPEEDLKDEENDGKKKNSKKVQKDPQVGYTLRRNRIHDAVETWSPVYYVSFNIKPLYIRNTWTSVIHFTTGGNSGAIGRRIPAVFMIGRSTRLHICTALNNVNNYCVNSHPLPLHKYTHVSIYQYTQGTRYFYRVRVGGRQIVKIQNHIPRYYQNVKVYKANPWYPAAPANIRHLYYHDNSPYAPQPLRRNTLIKRFPTYFSEYDVTFQIKPYGKVQHWASILQVTRGRVYGRHGDRVPAIWFIPKTNRLHICTTRNSNKNYCYNSAPLPTNRYTRVHIRQKLFGNRHWYSIRINNKVVRNVVNFSPRTFRNVKVYQANPWNPAAKAFIRGVKVTTSSGGGYRLSRNKLISLVPRIEKQWYLSFNIRPFGPVKKHWTNILHATTGGNYGRIGYRIPGIWFRPKTRKLHICSAINNNHNYCRNFQNLPVNRYTNVQVAQVYLTDTKRYRYVILINNVLKFSIINHRPYVFHNVRLFAGGPWYNSANGIIKNLVFRSIPSK